MQLSGSKKIKVLLDGQGSDEYLAGYMHSFYRLIGGLLTKFNLGKALSVLSEHRHQQQFSFGKSLDIFSKSLLSGMKTEQSLYQMEYTHYYPFMPNKRVFWNNNEVVKMDNNDGSRLNNFLYQLLFTSSLPTLLHYEDRNSMAYSIESRVPFLDHRSEESTR